MASFKCSNCRRRITVPPDFRGELVRCPYCEAVVPNRSQPVASSRPAKKSNSEPDDDEGGQFSKPMAKIDQEELIDMTAMVDIVFFLLIFFLVTSMAAVHSSMQAPVPEAKDEGGGSSKSLQDLEAGGDSVVVRINREDRVDVDGVVVADLSDLPSIFRQARVKGGPQMGLLVIGHGEASHGRAVTVLDMGYEAGMERVRLAVSDRDADPD